MGDPLRILILEDSEDDAALVLREVSRGELSIVGERVSCAETMSAAIRGSDWDIIIADYALPGFTALQAMRMVQDAGLDVPFIIVSGQIGEDAAVELMKAGASDYVAKDRLGRLVPAIERELREAKVRRERREAEVALRESEERFRSLVKNSSDIITVLSAEGTIRYSSLSTGRILGYGPEEMVGRSAFDFVHPDDLEAVLPAFARVIQKPETVITVEYRFLHADGTWVPIESVGSNFLGDPSIRGIVVNSRDVTDRRQAEAALRESEERYREFIEGTEDLVTQVDSRGQLMFVNHVSRRVFGLPPEACVGLSSLEFIHPDDREATARMYIEWTKRRARHVTLENRQVSRSGQVRSLLWTINLHYDEQGNVTSFNSIGRDITERKHAEQDIQRSEQHFRSLVENSTDIISVLDERGALTYVSPPWEKLLGYTKDEVLGRNVFELLHAEDRQEVYDAFARGNRIPGHVETRVFRFLHKDGTYRVMEATGTNLLEDSAVKGVVINARDITEQRQSEVLAQQRQAELAHAARLSTVGEMTSELAHELGQPLTAIAGYARSCVQRMQSGNYQPERLLATMEKVAVQSERAGEVIHNIRAFLRKDPGPKVPTDVNEIVRDAVALVRHESNSLRHPIELNLCRELLPVKAVRIEIEQVVVNLVRNGLEAMRDTEPRDARLSITTGRNGGGQIEVAIADRGTGFAEGTQERLFSPFFTTKPDGMGMGLAISRRIIEAHGGRLSAWPNRNRGVTFTFTLPVSNWSLDDGA
ncbi:MAG: PAS domain S-box protein [Phycisphaerae bacterium]|nr:PAS domain S-box protein [Phycisphaerae bacterium]